MHATNEGHGHFRYWHETDMPKYLGDVRCWVNSEDRHFTWLSGGLTQRAATLFFFANLAAAVRPRVLGRRKG